MALFGICASNKPGDFGLDTLKRLQPRYLVVMEANKGAIADVRRELPDCRIALRAEDAGKAWDPPGVGYTPELYAEDFANLMNETRPDIGIPWNEANIEWASMFPDSNNCTPAQYDRFADWVARFYRRYRRLSDVPIAWPALSPGHRTDDYEQSSILLKTVAGMFDEIHFHFYYPDFTEWAGRRYLRELPFYRDLGKPLVITETNRPFNRNDAADVARMVEDTRRFYAEAGPHFAYIVYFMENSDSFPELNSRDCAPLEDLFISFATAAPQGGSMAKPTKIYLYPVAPAKPGDTVRVTGRVTGVDGTAGILATIKYPPKNDNEAWAVDDPDMSPTLLQGDGDFTLSLPIVADPGNTEPLGCKIQVNTVELDPSAGAVFDGGEAFVDFVLLPRGTETNLNPSKPDTGPSAIFAPVYTPAPSNPQNVSSAGATLPDGVRLDRAVAVNAAVYDLAGKIQKFGQDIHNWYRYGKGEIETPPVGPS